MEHYEMRDCYPDIDGDESPIDTNKSNIRNAFKGAKVFITGGTGLLGSLLIEKIARSCPDFGKIFLLLRPKRDLTSSERLEALFQDDIFQKLKRENPDFISRVFIMDGDIGEPMCGLSLENQKILREEVNFVYHNAACLKMTEPIKSAYYLNVQSTKHLLDLGTEMKYLKGFVYVSTAYSNCFRPDISEQFYPTTFNWEQLKDLVERLSDYELSCLTPKLIRPWVNTYAFTKAISEDLVKSYVRRLPVAIARPSIVVGTYEEPLRGWINNVYGAVGVSAGASTGIIRVWYADKNKIADIIPADYVVNTIIAISWKLAKNHERKIKKANPIYNIVSSPKAPTTWGEYMNESYKYPRESEVATCKAIGEYALILTRRKWLYFMLFYILHITQSVILDTALVLQGKPAVLFNTYGKIMKFNMMLAYFCEREWVYEQKNVDSLLKDINREDKTIFPFDMASFSWKTYHISSVRAIFKYIVKSEDCENPCAARKKYKRFIWARQIVTGILVLATGYWLVC